MMAESGELGTEAEVEDTELVDPSLEAAVFDEEEEVEPVRGSCLLPPASSSELWLRGEAVELVDGDEVEGERKEKGA